jgi:hypothetical protein
MKTSVNLLNKGLIHLFTKLWDKSMNIVVHNKQPPLIQRPPLQNQLLEECLVVPLQTFHCIMDSSGGDGGGREAE